MRAHLNVSGLVGPFALLVTTNVCDILLTNITIPPIRVCLCRTLRLHLVLEGKLEELFGLQYCQRCVENNPREVGITYHLEQLVDILIRDTMVCNLHATITFQETQKFVAEVLFLLRCSEEQRHVECRALRCHYCGCCL